MQDYIKKNGIRDLTHISLLSAIEQYDSDFTQEFTQKISYIDFTFAYDFIDNGILTFESYSNIIKKIKDKIYNIDNIFLLKLIKKIFECRKEYYTELHNDIFLKSYLRVATYHTIKETKISTKDVTDTIKEISPNIAVLQDILSKNDIKLNNKEIKSLLTDIPNLTDWLNEIKPK
jgi:hypothetical protein